MVIGLDAPNRLPSCYMNFTLILRKGLVPESWREPETQAPNSAAKSGQVDTYTTAARPWQHVCGNPSLALQSRGTSFPPRSSLPWRPALSLTHAFPCATAGFVSAGGGDRVLPEKSSPASSSGGEVENGAIVRISPQLSSTGVTSELGGKSKFSAAPNRQNGEGEARAGGLFFFFFPPQDLQLLRTREPRAEVESLSLN